MNSYLKYFSGLFYLIVVFLSILPANSETTERRTTYRPPTGQVRHQNRKAGGSRGCNLPSNDTVTLIVPQDHTATTVSAHPIFFWHLSQKLSLPLRFTLLEPGKKPLFTKELKPDPGIVALKLPENSPPLEIGKTYRWTVTVVCNQKKPSRNLFATAWIKRASSPAFNQLSEVSADTSFCSLEYAKAGIWYDALSCNYALLVENQKDLNHNSPEFWSLLEEIDLQNLVQRKPRLNLY